MPKSIATTLAYRPEIDGLRALAVIVVILFHVGLGCPGGYVGVDIFFVISGFLITSLLLKAFDAGTFTFVGFYERRARRILPASFVVTLIVLAVGYFRLLPLDLEELGYSAIAHALFGANFFFYSVASNYFAPGAAGMPLLHMWSLAVEEQFYFLFPLLLFACYRYDRFRSRRAIRVMLCTLFIASLGLSVAVLRVNPSAAFFMLPTRGWELMTGAILAVMPTRNASRITREFTSLVGLAGMLLPVFLYSAATPFPGIAALPPCLGAALFIWSCGGRANENTIPFHQAVIGRLFASPVSVFIGTISYSLYLCHWPILVLGKYWKLTPLTMTDRLVIVVCSFVAAIVLWLIVERPFRQRRVGGTRRSMFVAAAGGIIAVLAIGIVFKVKDGLPSRFSPEVNALDDVRRFHPRVRGMVTADIANDRLTPFGDPTPGLPVSLLVWGDSHASAALPAFDEVCKEHHLSGRIATHSSTPPLLDFFISSSTGLGDDTIKFNHAVIDYVARNRIKTVVLIDYWTRDVHYDPDALDRALGRTIAALNKLGVHVYVMLQVPSYEVEVPKALAYEAIHNRQVNAWRETLKQHEANQAVMYRLAKKYESPDCTFIDPAPSFLLNGETYVSVINHGRSIYRDEHHLSLWGARKMLEPFLEKTIFAAQ